MIWGRPKPRQRAVGPLHSRFYQKCSAVWYHTACFTGLSVARPLHAWIKPNSILLLLGPLLDLARSKSELEEERVKYEGVITVQLSKA